MSAAARAAAFTGICAVVAAQWSTLVSDPSAARFALAALAPAAAAWGLLALARSDLGPHKRSLATAAIAGVAAAIGLGAVGLPAGELPPWRWGDLADSVDRGLGGLDGEFQYPLRSANELAGPVLVAAFPLLLVLAAVLAFRPGRRPGPALAGLVIAVAAYAIPATARPTSAPALWGLALLGLIALWLWGPRMRARAAIALMAGFGALAAAASGALAAEDPPIDYRSWTLGADDGNVRFQWDHTYGPLRWPREGTPVFNVTSERPGYWKAESLDEFYSTAWRRSITGGEATPLPSDLGADSRWVRPATFTVLALEGVQVVTPGTALSVEGIDGVEQDPDGTFTVPDDPLRDGSEYTVSAYAPEPSPRRLRESTGDYPPELGEYTTIWLPVPRPRTSLSPASELISPDQLEVPLWGAEPRPTITHAIELSPYARMRRLTHRLVDQEPTPYDAARAIERYLERNHRYRERPPRSRVPLNAFLFRDRIGYCQHFSGAMALMLRMAGIPARVAVGFSPGTAASSGGTYRVTDLDAHSWVEVYFDGVGWVTFDPTPAAAPASSQLSELGAGAFRFVTPDRQPPSPNVPAVERQRPEAASAEEGSGGSSWLGTVALAAAALTALAVVAALLRTARHRRRSPERAVELQLAEVPAALDAVGRRAAGSATLLALERTLLRQRRPRAAAYLAALRSQRFEARGGAVPGLRRRRQARRELGSGRGFATRLRLLAAMPPGGPSKRSR